MTCSCTCGYADECDGDTAFFSPLSSGGTWAGRPAPSYCRQQRALPAEGGYDHGPLFRHGEVRRNPRRIIPQDHGRIRCRAERTATPAWTTPQELREWERIARAATKSTGVQMSLGHIVPLQHDRVCGLHCPANFCIEPLQHNMVKGNRYWPDMWGEQTTLFTEGEA